MIAAQPTAASPPVVVGFDGSEAATCAVDVAADEARRRHTSLVVFVVAGCSLLWWDSVEGLYGDNAAAIDQATVIANRGAHRARQRWAQLPVRVVVSLDLESSRLAAVAERAQILVLGEFGLRGHRCLSTGSTSAALAHVFRCPLLVVRRRGEDSPPRGETGEPRAAVGSPASDVETDFDYPGVVVAAVDGREGSAAVMQAATVESRLRRRPLVALHADEKGTLVPSHRALICQRLFDQALSSLVPSGGRLDRLVLTQDEPVAALKRGTNQQDLLVLGWHAHGSLRASDPQDVIRQALEGTPCDVLVVRPAGI
jgi:nucleotide-binding universal stress UspA family protein